MFRLTLFFKDFISLFLEKVEGKEKEREKNINVSLPLARPRLGTWPTTQAYALTGNRTGYPLPCSPVLNSLSHTSQGKSVELKSFHALSGNPYFDQAPYMNLI